MSESDSGQCHRSSVVVFLEHSSQRLFENLVSSGVDERVDTEVDEAESNKDVEQLQRQRSALITSYTQ